jgi:hypothetical protein
MIRPILLATCLSLGVTAPTVSTAHAIDNAGYLATGAPETPTENSGLMAFFNTSSELARINHEYVRLLAEIAEYEFSDFCAFNVFDAQLSTGMLHSYPCLKGDGFRAVMTKDAVQLFKLDGKRVIRLQTSVTRENDHYKLVDFQDVRRAFGLPETSN